MLFTDSQAEIVLSLLPKITKINQRGISFLGSSGSPATLPHSKFLKQFDISSLVVSPELMTMALKDRESFNTKLQALISTLAIEKAEEARSEISDSISSLSDTLSKLIPVVNSTNPEEKILVDKEYRKSYLSADLLEKVLFMTPQEIVDRGECLSFEYNPRRKERRYEEKLGHEMAKCINTYNPPEWMSIEIENPVIPPLIDKFMNHLFPIKEELEYVYDWLHKSLTDRAYVYLLLNGPKETGKNTFKTLFTALHGLTNSADGKLSTLKTQFNSQLSECRALILDEVRFTENEDNIMKEIQNDNISIEKKGVDATRSSKIHCSILLLNNDVKDNYIAVDSRRYSPMNITHTRLPDAIPEEDTSEMLRKIKENGDDFDINFVANFGHWILKYGRNYKWGKEACYKGPKFFELVQTSLSEWRRFTVKTIEDCRNSGSEYQYTLSEIGTLFYKKVGTKKVKIYPDHSRVTDFIKYYRDINGLPIATVSKVEGEYDFYVIPLPKDSKEVKPSSEEDNLEGFYTSSEEYSDGL